MKIETAIGDLVGDLSRFDDLADRVEGLIENQVARYRPGVSDWLVVPWVGGFYLFSEDNEGQRRGREVVLAFLGPSVVSLETVSNAELSSNLPASWRATGLVKATGLRLIGGRAKAEAMISRLEEMATALSGRRRHVLEVRPTHSDLLRDFRLALLRKDDDSARALLEDIRLNGTVSAENLRYLRIEYLAAFQRWAEMRELPHLQALLQARRPRAVSETLLRMVLWTELVGVGTSSAATAFRERDVAGIFGPLLRAVWVPSSPEGRIVGFLAALADGDVNRQERILEGAADEEERAKLRSLAAPEAVPTSAVPAASEISPAAIAFEQGRYSDVIEVFLSEPDPASADVAVQAVLESGVVDAAREVLHQVRDFQARGVLSLGRRERRDLEDLEKLTSDSCSGWVDWSVRVGGDARWADANSALKDSAGSWQPLGSLGSKQIDEVCSALLGAVGGCNDDQLRASLDVFCSEAAAQLALGSANEFCRTVLLLLSEQDNFSEMVRGAYLDLFAAWLEIGPSAAEYGELIELTSKIWMRVRSPNALGWAISIVEAVADAPSPDPTVRSNFVIQVINDARTKYYSLASIRERAEIEDLAEYFGLPSQPVEASEVERDLWSKLNGKSIGIYSLLPRSKSLLERRLARLCSVAEVRGNDDQVATPALRTLASRVDFMIVDTWHAAHQATYAIDSVRPRDQQVLPRQRGVTGFLRALESALES